MKGNIQTASVDDISLMIEWAKAEGWNPGLNDAIPFQATNPTGFLIGRINDIPISCISVVRYANRFAFLGFYIVKPEYRGKGYGFAIWQAGMNYLQGYTIGLDGVIDQQPNYQRSGFKLAHRNIRYGGEAMIAPARKNNLVDVRKIPFDLLLEFDQRYFPAPRPQFLSPWLSLSAHQGWAYVKENKIKGYGIIRQCYEGYKIGPLFSETREVAEQIFSQLCQQAHASKVFLDVPELNINAKKLAEQAGLQPVFETARMYTNDFPAINLDHVFGITTFELG